MTKRLKPHKSGARFTVREDDLLHALIMPPSLDVHVVRVIVALSGSLEFAEWITGVNGTYLHREEQLTSEQIADLQAMLAVLVMAERRIKFDRFEIDNATYESRTRIVLRFRSDGKERGFSLPSSQFYLDHDIPEKLRNDYESAFNAILAKLPLNWITTSN